MILRKALLTTAVGLFIAWVVPGCSDDDSSSSGQKFIGDYCGIMASCCETWGGTNDNGARCKEVFGFYAMGSLNQSAADACLAKMRQEQTDGTLCESKPASSVSEEDPCNKALGTTSQNEQNGTSPPGSDCDTSSDCAAPAGGIAQCDSVSADGGFDHYCQAVKPGKQGDPCTVSILSNGGSTSIGTGEKELETIGCSKAEGLYCDLYGSKTCKAVVADGSPCTGNSECVDGSFCKSSLCAPNLTEGEACEQYTSVCGTGLYCDDQSKSCAKLKHLGDACTSMNECTSMDCTDEKCGPGWAAMFSAMMMCKM